jgi:hypothetical protein
MESGCDAVRDEGGKGWRRIGDGFGVDWADAAWTFGIADGRAGLLREGGPGPFLCVTGLAAVGRRNDGAFTADSLVGIDVVHGRLLATFEPAGWHGLTVRAGWGLCRDGRGMDLEIQATATSVGALRRLEILAAARPPADASPDSEPRLLVEPRDRSAAGSSYDGREPDDVLTRLATLEVGRRSAPIVRDGYFEIAHPDDAARTIRAEMDMGRSTRHGFFGFDLERGVVLRGRLRGVFLDDPRSWRDERDRFLAEPPPLRTD